VVLRSKETVMLLIGFGNKARQGKDEAAQAVKNYFEDKSYQWNEAFNDGRSVKVGIFKFATALYEEVNAWLKVTTQDGNAYDPLGSYVVPPDSTNGETYTPLPDWVKPEPNAEISQLAPYGKHPLLLQWWGTEYRRKQDPHYWVKKLLNSVLKDSKLDIVLITDVRFLNEAAGIRHAGGYMVRIQRLDESGTQYLSPDRDPLHRSEIELDNYIWDFELKIPHGHQALLGELAITYVEYLRGLEKK
jgi:hypothetical protein